ncbi:Spo19p [Saccharomyces cerevisiae x Saccharomyces kudriavzevii VIN7]|uniref:Spo19p n=1 Tax=Saccharomyces cerevisiae x Saccharomyces kudriavzevii (strain VIN7) TaxID=1095631 RepID=H0H200_SACCK|nr:Spo19p [Saccharomyces cerevisiae x Saccharomyces kudriavzevii VIN7]
MRKQILLVAAQSILCSTVFGERTNVGLSTEELGGDSIVYFNEEPIVVEIDKNSIDKKALEHLANTRNVVLTDLPETLEFIDANEYAKIKAKSDMLLEYINEYEFDDFEGSSEGGLDEEEEEDLIYDFNVQAKDTDKFNKNVYEAVIEKDIVDVYDNNLTSSTTIESSTTIDAYKTFHSYVASSTPYSNVSISDEDYDNAGTYLTPTTVALAVMLTILLFIQTY